MKTPFLCTLLLLASGTLQAAETAPAKLQAKETLEGVAALQPDTDRVLCRSIDAALRTASPAKKAAFEEKLRTLATQRTLAPAARREICRWLGLIGTDASISLLVSWCDNSETGSDALRALAAIPGAASAEALRGLLKSAPASLLPGIMDALALRHDLDAIPALSACALAADPLLAGAAIEALGRLGSNRALEVLLDFKPEPSLRETRNWALLAAASSCLTAPGSSGARQILRDLTAQASSGALREAAARALLNPPSPDSFLETMALLGDRDLAFGQSLAAAWLGSAARNPALAPLDKLSAALPSLAEPVQITLLTCSAQLGKREFLPLGQTLLSSERSAVRAAAFAVLGACGDLKSAELLLTRLETETDAASAVAALSQLRVEGLDSLLRNACAKATPGSTAALLQVLSNRVDRESMPFVLATAVQSSPGPRAAAFKALPILARGKDLESILALKPSLKTGPEHRGWHEALLNVVRMTADAERIASLLKAELGKIKDEDRKSLIVALVLMEAPAAIKVLEAELGAPDSAARKDVIRALSSAKSQAAAELLRRHARKVSEPTEKILCQRGVIDNLVAAPLQEGDRIKQLKSSYPELGRTEGKEALIAALKNINSKASLKAAEDLQAKKP